MHLFTQLTRGKHASTSTSADRATGTGASWGLNHHQQQAQHSPTGEANYTKHSLIHAEKLVQAHHTHKQQGTYKPHPLPTSMPDRASKYSYAL